MTSADKTFVISERSEFERLQALVRTVEDGDLPRLPEPDSRGNYPALPYARASLARKIIRRRKSASLTQADLARRAGIRPETLSRLKKGNPAATWITGTNSLACWSVWRREPSYSGSNPKSTASTLA